MCLLYLFVLTCFIDSHNSVILCVLTTGTALQSAQLTVTHSSITENTSTALSTTILPNTITETVPPLICTLISHLKTTYMQNKTANTTAPPVTTTSPGIATTTTEPKYAVEVKICIGFWALFVLGILCCIVYLGFRKGWFGIRFKCSYERV